MPLVLNIMPFNLMMRILIYISAAFSIFYFIMSVGEIIHIIYNHFRPNYDWQEEEISKKMIADFDKTKHSEKLATWVVMYAIIIVLLIIIVPLIFSGGYKI